VNNGNAVVFGRDLLRCEVAVAQFVEEDFSGRLGSLRKVGR
jgi:hypothetical protein